MKTINFIKVRDVKSPTRSNATDAGVDFYVPNDWKGPQPYMFWDPKLLSEKEASEVLPIKGAISLGPNESVNIPSGIKVEVPEGYALVFFNKSGRGKDGLITGAQVVDCGYTGEVHLNVWNVSRNQLLITPGMKLVQAILIPIGIFQFTEQPKDYIMSTFGSKRGSDGFGSTDSK